MTLADVANKAGHTSERTDFLKRYPTLSADPAVWKTICGASTKVFLDAFRNGGLGPKSGGFELLLAQVWKMSRGCDDFRFRISLLGYVALQALQITPRALNGPRPPMPPEVELSIVTLLEVLEDQNPALPTTPSRSGRETTLTLALKYLEALGIDKIRGRRITDRSIYELSQKHRRCTRQASRPGRKRSKTRKG